MSLSESDALFSLIDLEEMLFQMHGLKSSPALKAYALLTMLETEGWVITAPDRKKQEKPISNVVNVDFKRKERIG
jgi:hypothetical protein